MGFGIGLLLYTCFYLIEEPSLFSHTVFTLIRLPFGLVLQMALSSHLVLSAWPFYKWALTAP